MRKRVLVSLFTIALLCLTLAACAGEDPSKAAMQEKAGENHRITGSYDKDLSVTCHNGIFVGKKDGSLVAYKGIPYAEPPVGDLRWKDPVPAAPDKGVYEAYYFGKSPIQTEWPSEVGSYYPQSEDCLKLNVWANQKGPASGRPVAVFIHGGSYGWGATSDPLYDGANLVAKYPDLIVVTVGYRTGILGFIDLSEVPGGEAYATSGNLGLLDQVCALKWVQKNIAAFGGDPDNVTIWGESAGAGSVVLLPLMDGTKGYFHRIIAESGSVNLTYSREECQNLTQMLLEKSGCRTMEDLTALSEEELIALNEDLNDYNNFPERDGVVLPEDLYGAWERADLSGLDLLIGTNRDEVRYWIRELGYYAPALPDMLIYRHMIPLLYDNNCRQLSKEERESAEAFLSMQSGKKVWQLTEFYNDLLFRVPVAELAARHADAGGNSYVYWWTMGGGDDRMGACHAIELSYVFNNPQETIYTGETYNEELAGVTQDMWVNFIRTGDPGAGIYSWEPYTRSSRKVMILGETVGMEADPLGDRRALIEPLLPHYFNGCYSQMSFWVPQGYRIIGQVILTLLLLIACAAAIARSVKKRK